MKTITETHQDIIVFSVEGRIDAISAAEFEARLFAVIESIDKPFLLDCKKLRYISSAGLRVVLITARQLKEKQVSFFISGLEGPVKDVFELSGFYSIFKIYSSVEDVRGQLA